MEKNVIRTSVVNSSSTLEDKEHYAVGLDGVLTASAGDYVYGIVSSGRPADEASEIITGGECEAYVDGSSTSIAAEDPLTGGADGKLIKATLGSHLIRAIAKEAATTDGALIEIVLY